jgi:hypothetical protein
VERTVDLAPALTEVLVVLAVVPVEVGRVVVVLLDKVLMEVRTVAVQTKFLLEEVVLLLPLQILMELQRQVVLV